jgi:class 3 adenylate cyclase/streptogramin lyase
VTFLFTDVEGSTRLVRRLGDDYASVLGAHQRLLRGAFAAHGGHEVDTQGDAFFVAFRSARDAVLAAVDGQRALLEHAWPEGGQVRVRMGVHSGRAAAQDGRFTGLSVHRAARISAVGHGGQVVVSHATRALLDDEEEVPGVSLRDLGERRLKDFDQPVRLYQLEAASLPAEFPELTAPRAERPFWRRPAVAAAALLVAAVAAVGVALAIGSSRGGGAGRVAVIDPESDSVAGSVPAGREPGPVTSGAGSIWVGNLADRTVTRIDPVRRVRAATVPLEGRSPSGLDYGANGLWVATGPRGQLSKVSARTNRLVKDATPANPGSERGAVDATKRDVWVAYGDSTVARIDPTTLKVSQSVFAGDSLAGVVAAGGAVWVLNAGGPNVMRLDPLTLKQRGDPIPVGEDPSAIAASDGAIWVAERGEDAVARINVFTGDQVPVKVGSEPGALAVGGGAVWVTNSGDGTVTRIDLVSNETTSPIDVGGRLSGIAYADDFVWVAVQSG